jgi:hypothetical protein
MKLFELLYDKNNHQLKSLAKYCGCRSLNRKEELVRCIQQALLNPDLLRQVWQQLDELSQKAVAAAYHNEGEFDPSAFAAQYGALPGRVKGGLMFGSPPPLPLDLFLYQNTLPSDLIPLLARLVPPPDKYQISGTLHPPQEVVGRGRHKAQLIKAETEQAGLHDLRAYLRLAGQGELGVSSTSENLTLAGVKKFTDNLLLGDFLPLAENYRANQTIRPVGLSIFAREAGLTAYNGRSGLHLTKAGQQFYQTQSPELLLEAFETWSQKGSFDELSRISGLSGLKSPQTRLTRPATRREAVIEALSWCPVNVWIDLQDFYRALKIWHFDFEVETSHFSNLYIGSKEYGALYGEPYAIVKELYVNVVLWEYLGSIGALDLLYTPPEEANLVARYSGFMYIEEPYLSLYDGLRYFRVNDLGAYLFGQAGEYRPAAPLQAGLFTISPELDLSLTRLGDLTPNDEHLLNLLAVPLGQGRYRLETQLLLSAVETGHDWAELADFLSSRHHGPLPPAVTSWLARLQAKSRAFKNGGPALLVKVDDETLLEMVLADPTLQKLCSPLDRRTLVVPESKEKAFRSRLRELEYILN